MGFFLERLVEGLSLGTVLGLLGAANSLCWTANRPLLLANMAFYVTGVAISLAAISAARAGFAPFALLIGAAAAMAAAVSAGIGIHIATRRTTDHSQLTIISSAGLLLMAVAALQFATQLPLPAVLNQATAPRFAFASPFFALTIPAAQPAIIIAGAAFLLAVWLLVGFTRFSRRQRAAVQDPKMAELFGIDVGRGKLTGTLICAAVASCAGALSVIDGQSTNMDGVLLTFAIAFVAAAIAGLCSITRAVGGGVITGLAVAFWSGYLNQNYGELAAFATLLFLLIFLPSQPAIRATSEQV